jgi:hypothetical protein
MGRVGSRLSQAGLLNEFDLHRDRANRLPTALVSVTDRPIEALHRGFEKVYNLNEEPEEIWIAIIFVPDTDVKTESIVYHPAKELAKQLESVENPNVFEHEYVFEWEIPEQYVEHRVSLQTLRDRGLDLHEYLDGDDDLPNLTTLRQDMTERLLNPSFSSDNISRSVAQMARCFGARAPVHKIASQFMSHLPCLSFVDHDYQYVYWAGYSDPIDFEHLHWVLLGIEEELSDHWLADSEFLLDYKAHRDWASHLREEMHTLWDHYQEDIYETVWSGAEPESSDDYARELRERERQMEAKIEGAAIAIGL